MIPKMPSFVKKASNTYFEQKTHSKIYLVHDVSKLHHSHSNKSVFSGETIIFDTYVKLKTVEMLLISNNAVWIIKND